MSLSSSRYCWYCVLFSTFALIPSKTRTAVGKSLTLLGPQGSDDDGWRGNQIVGERVVEVALELEDVLDLLKLLLEPSSELLEALLMGIRVGADLSLAEGRESPGSAEGERGPSG